MLKDCDNTIQTTIKQIEVLQNQISQMKSKQQKDQNDIVQKLKMNEKIEIKMLKDMIRGC